MKFGIPCARTIILFLTVVTVHACANDDDKKLAESVPPPPSQTAPPPPAQAVSPTDGTVPPTSTTSATADSDAKSLNDYDPNKPGDYVHSKLPLKDSDFDTKREILAVVQRHEPRLSLKMLRFYDITKEDLEPLKSPEVTKVTTELILWGTKLPDDVLEQISLLKLNAADLHGNKARDLHYLRKMKTLKFLDLRRNQIDSSGMAVLGSLPNLTTLKLDGNKIADKDLEQLYGLKKLNKLFIIGCSVSPEAIAKLQQHCPTLTIYSQGPSHKSDADASHAKGDSE